MLDAAAFGVKRWRRVDLTSCGFILLFLIPFTFVQSVVVRNVEGPLVSRGLRQPERRVMLAERLRTLPGGEWMRVGDPKRWQDQWQPLAALFAALPLLAAAGRLRRPDGPALTGPAAILGVGAVVFVLRQFPLRT